MNIKNEYIRLVLLHVLIGVLCQFIPFFPKIYFVAALLYFIYRVFNTPYKNRTIEILLACAYFTGAEVFFRMSEGALTYESSKYLVIVFMAIGIFYKGISGRGYTYIFYLGLLIPSILVASMTLTYSADFRKAIAFVLSGPICLGVAALFCYDKRVTKSQLLDIITVLALPAIAMTAYLFIDTPSIKDALSGTASNRATSGGFGPNQVSTALGLAIFSMVVLVFTRSQTTILKVINLSILGAMTFRAIVTFSRGGVFTAILMVIAFLVIYYFQSSRARRSSIMAMGFLFLSVLAITWVVSSDQTGGLIDKRYSNQDAAGRSKSDVSTGRISLFRKELDGFFENPIVGVGASRMANKRLEEEKVILTSHNEMSRLLSEHGMIGLIILLILIFKPLAFRSKHKGNYLFYAFLCFWFATVNHSSMRIAAPAFIYALSLLKVTNAKRTLLRKQLS